MKKCIDSRMRNGMRWRKYRLDDDRIITTYEVPETVLRHLTFSRVRIILEGFQRQEVKRARTAGIKKLIERGVKPLAIADYFKVSPEYVRVLRRKIKGTF